MGPSNEEILAALEPVNDPELNRSIVELGMVKNVAIKRSKVQLEVALTIPGCPLKGKIEEDVKAALEKLEGVSEATI